MWEWVLRNRIFDSCSRYWNRDFPEIPIFLHCGSSEWASVMVWLWKAGTYLKIGNWSVIVLFGWSFVFGIIVRWEGR